MNFSDRQRDPKQHLVGLTAVVAFHVLIVWALVSGLAKKVVDIVRAPIETKVIEEIKKPPPPPEVVVPPPPKLEAPPPPYIPPPEVVVSTPPPPPTVTLAPTPTPPPVPVEIVPAPPPPPVAAPVAVAPPPVVHAAPPPAPPPAPKAEVSAGAACANYKPALIAAGFPVQAARAHLDKGEVVLRFTIGPGGRPQNVTVVTQTNPIFGRAAAKVVAESVVCESPEGQVVVTPVIAYNAE